MLSRCILIMVSTAWLSGCVSGLAGSEPVGGGATSTATSGATSTTTSTTTSVSTDAGTADPVSEACIAAAGSLRDCKNCCDCASDSSCEVQVACRDRCNALDTAYFSNNPSARPFSADTRLGAEGDYAPCTGLATDQECKSCCDCSGQFACGDHRFCRDACAAKFGVAPPKPAKSGG